MVPRSANAIVAIAYAAFLSPAALGIYGVCLAMQSILAFLLDGGISQAIVRTYYDHHANSEAARAYLARMVVTSRVLSLLVSLLLLLAGAVAWGPITAYAVPLWPIFPLVLLAGYLERGGELLANICRALERPKIFAIGDSAQAIVLVASAFLFVVILKMSVLGAVLALIAGSSARTVIFSAFLRKEEKIRWVPKLSSYRELHEAVTFGTPLVVSQLSTWGRQMGQRVVLLHVVSAADVGAFFLAGSVANILLVVVQAVGFVFDPLYYKRRVEDAAGFREKVQTFTEVYFAVLAIIVVPCILFADELIHALFHNKYAGVGPIAGILLAASYTRIQQPFIAKQLRFQKKTGMVPVATLLPTVIALVATPFVVPFGGLVAVAWLVLLTSIISLVTLGLAVRRHEELDYPTGTAAILLTIVCAAAYWESIGTPAPVERHWEIALKLLAVAITTAACSLAWVWRHRRFLRQIARG